MNPEIRRLAVLGAGTMGRGIAHVAAVAGFITELYDTQQSVLNKAEASIHRNLARGVELGKLKAEVADQARGQLHLVSDLPQAVRDADLVIEAAPEDIALKNDLFRQVVAHAPAHALLASNTSALSITEMAAASGRADRFAGMHFFNPVHLMSLVALVR